MTVTVTLPLTDPTCDPLPRHGERVLDAGRRFWDRVGSADLLLARAAELDVPEPDPDRADDCLLALAAADALADPHSSAGVRLRALGAAARLACAGDAGLIVSVDDVELRSGSTQSSADTLRAAKESTLFAPETDWLVRELAGESAARVVLDTDQQLPAALALLAAVPPYTSVVLSGRFAASYRAALARLPLPGNVSWDPEPHQRCLAATGTDDPAVRWIESADACPGDGPWCGWLDAAQAAALSTRDLARCAGLVVSAARLTAWDGVTGIDGDDHDLTGVIGALAGRVPVAAELLVGAPGVPDADVERAFALLDVAGVRLAGFRPFRLPAGRVGGRWHGVAVEEAADPGDDLARWARPVSTEGPTAGDRVAALLSRWAGRHDLFAGHLAGALLDTAPWPEVGPAHRWDPCVRGVATGHSAPAGSEPGDFLVSLRTGRVIRTGAPLAALAGRLRRGGGAAVAALDRLAPDRRAALTSRLTSAGVLVERRDAR